MNHTKGNESKRNEVKLLIIKMNTSLRYISISHKTATAVQREQYHIADEEKSSLVKQIKNAFTDITGLFILATCNRTEVYFESVATEASTMRDFVFCRKATHSFEGNKQLFEYSNTSEHTVKHLLTVSSGLTSSVLGDAEVIHQVKKAYQFSIAHQLQGSLLERAMQAAFKNHKRVSNETCFRDGTTSLAYRSLKVIENTFTKEASKSKKILFIGAGDIVKQLFKYNSKFNFTNIYISNRTEEKATILANQNQCKVFSWKKVLANELKSFDVIISAVSNSPLLIKNIPVSAKKVLLIDLAMPGNIAMSVAKNDATTLYNLDTISIELRNNKVARMAAIDQVKNIITEELSSYIQWLHKAPMRASLATYKKIITKKITDSRYTHLMPHHNGNTKIVTNQIIRKLISQPEAPLSSEAIDVIIAKYFSASKVLS